MAEDLRHFLQTAAESVGPRSPRPPPPTPDSTQETTPIPPTSGRPTPTRSRSRSCPKGCARSTSRTPIFSWNCCRVRGTGTVCPTASASGRPGSSNRPRPDLPRGPDLRSVGVWQVVAGQGGACCPDWPSMSCRFTSKRPRRDRNPFAQGFRKGCPALPRGLGWSIRWRTWKGRSSAGQKVLIVLDQFEQWLHAAGRGRTPSWSPLSVIAMANISRRS